MRVSITQLKEMKQRGEKIIVLTAYDYPTAQMVERAGVPVILVGDSLGNVVLGYESTLPVTMDEMLHHTKAVTRAVKNALVVGDMPFMSYQVSADEALRNAARFMQEGGAHAVKLEGGAGMCGTVKRIVDAGIPVMGHIGLTPQSIYQLGGFKAQGKTVEAAKQLVADAKALEQAGAFAVVLETIPAELASFISKQISIPSIGIGAGAACDGQVQVVSDILGLFGDFVPKHTRRYAHLADDICNAVAQYARDVTAGDFPAPKESIEMPPNVMQAVMKDVA
ncbi:MAG: 3-methyl-2-oxobutanoate hydroxymethyltransferase [Dehalococcoidia bacterium]|nr:3-methyl-2-oxobutanoate hydroxymethyltransferase [Dehalococcoidia bacterium]